MAKKMTREEFRLHLTLMGASIQLKKDRIRSSSDLITIGEWMFVVEYPDIETGFYYLWNPLNSSKGAYTKHKVPNFDVALFQIKKSLESGFRNV